MTFTISILAAALAVLSGLALFAPLSELRRRGLRATLVSAAIAGGCATGLFCAAFAALTLSGKPAFAPLSMHALMAALAVPLVVGLATVAFAAMSALSPAVFDRVNDRYAANIYVLLGVAIVVFCASSSLKADWPGYVAAAFVVPFVPSLTARRLKRLRPSGFAAVAEDLPEIESYRQGRAGQTESRWAEPVIAARAASGMRLARSEPAAARPAAARSRPPAREPDPREQPRRAPQSAAPRKAVAVPSPIAAARMAARKVDLAPVAKEAGRLVGDLRRKAAAAMAPRAEAVAAPAHAAARNVERERPAQRRARPAVHDAAPSRPAPRMPAQRAPEAPASPRPAPRQAVAARQASPAAEPPVQSRQHLPARAAARPTLLPPEAEPVRRPQARTLIEPIRPAAIATVSPPPRDPPDYPLTAPFEPGSDRWATLVDGILTTEDGVSRLISARATQAISPREIEAVVEDVSGAA